MPHKLNLNININRDDVNINDYLYVWSQFGQRPNKIALYHHYEPQIFFNIIQLPEKTDISTISDLIPTGQDYLFNEKSLVKLKENIYISYSQLDKLTDFKVISDVAFYYNNDSIKEVEALVDSLNQAEINYGDGEAQERFHSLTLTPDGLEAEPINLLETDYENIELYYNDSVIKEAKRTIKEIKKKNKGLSLLFGQRGTGKTHLINYIISNLDKMVIFIPSTMIDHTINNPDFLNLIKRYQNSIIVIDDCDTLFTDIYRKSTLFVNNLLQLIDGYQSDKFSLNFILSFNIDKEDLYDDTLLECNHLISQIELSELELSKVEELCDHLKYKTKIKNKAKLNDVIHKRSNLDGKIELGFN